MNSPTAFKTGEKEIAARQVVIVLPCDNYCDIITATGIKFVQRISLTQAHALFEAQKVASQRSHHLLVNMDYVEEIKPDGKVIFKKSFLRVLNKEDRAEIKKVSFSKRFMKGQKEKRRPLKHAIRTKTDFTKKIFATVTVASTYDISPAAIKYVLKVG